MVNVVAPKSHAWYLLSECNSKALDLKQVKAFQGLHSIVTLSEEATYS